MDFRFFYIGGWIESHGTDSGTESGTVWHLILISLFLDGGFLMSCTAQIPLKKCTECLHVADLDQGSQLIEFT